MLKEEFIARTGYTPTDAEYAAIEEDYYAFDGDKDAYCKAFDVKAFTSQSFNIRAEITRRAHQIEELNETVSELRRQNEDLKKERAALIDRLDEEQEWQLYDKGGTQIDQQRYEDLVLLGRGLSDDEAKAFIHRECGFDISMIEIVREAAIMEINRHHQTRVAVMRKREPHYESSDWNYVRFDVKIPCGTWKWEYINGTPHEYLA